MDYTKTQELTHSELKSALQSMDDEKFEYFVGEVWSREGWETEVSQQSQDKSLDVLAEKSKPYHQRHAIQAKRYQAENKVGGPSISEYASLTDYFDADAAVVVTTSGFTADARERAETLGVKLVDGDDLIEMIERTEAYDLLEFPTRDRESIETHNTEHNPAPQTHDRREGTWFRVLCLSGGVYVLSLALEIGGVATGPLFGVGLIGTVAALYIDIGAISESSVDWDPNRLVLLAGGLFFSVHRHPALLFQTRAVRVRAFSVRTD